MTNAKRLPTQDRLHELFYCVGGRLIRKISQGSQVSGDVAGYLNNLGYYSARVDSVNYKVHRLIWKFYMGTDPIGVIDHIDMNPSNNEIWNLRDVDQFTNRQNNMTAAKLGGNQWYTDENGICRLTDFGRPIINEKWRARYRTRIDAMTPEQKEERRLHRRELARVRRERKRLADGSE